MEFLEKDLEEIIFKAETNELSKRGLYVFGKRFRQLRIGNYGIADMVTIDKEYINHPLDCETKIHITIYELKKNKLDVNALLQACRYVSGIKRYLHKKNKFQNFEIEFKIVLIGKEVEVTNSFVYLTDYIDKLELYTYNYKIDGLSFENVGSWYLSNEGF